VGASLLTVLVAGNTVTPESKSQHNKDTITSVLFHPAVFATGKAFAVIAGVLSSMLTSTVVLAELPAFIYNGSGSSLIRSFVEQAGHGCAACNPESTSAHVKLTVTPPDANCDISRGCPFEQNQRS